MRTPLRALAFMTGALALTACSDKLTDPEATPSVSFTYSGPVSGSYHTQGVLRLQSNFLKQNGVAGVLESDELEVQALLQRGTSSVDIVTFAIPRTTVGAETITDGCAPDSGCARLLLGIALPHADGSQAAQSCSLTQGTMRVTEITGRRAKGEFSGTGSCTSDQGDLTEGFVVTGGKFDVPLL